MGCLLYILSPVESSNSPRESLHVLPYRNCKNESWFVSYLSSFITGSVQVKALEVLVMVLNEVLKKMIEKAGVS